MSSAKVSVFAKAVAEKEQEILAEWLDLQKKAVALQTRRITEAESNRKLLR